MAKRLQADDALLLIVDMQERLVPVMQRQEDLLTRVERAARAATLFGIPILLTEQYRKGLGPTVQPVRDATAGIEPIEKIAFSAVKADGFRAALVAAGRGTVLVAGIEAHVCILQSCLDLLEEQMDVVLLADCCSSRHRIDRETAVRRMESAGVMISTLESAFFEMLGVAGSEQFKEVSRLIKDLQEHA